MAIVYAAVIARRLYNTSTKKKYSMNEQQADLHYDE